MSAPEPIRLDLLVDEVGGYLTIAEAARRVRVCERKIRRAIESGELRGARGSRGAIRIRPADLDHWLYAEADPGDDRVSA